VVFKPKTFSSTRFKFGFTRKKKVQNAGLEINLKLVLNQKQSKTSSKLVQTDLGFKLLMNKFGKNINLIWREKQIWFSKINHTS